MAKRPTILTKDEKKNLSNKYYQEVLQEDRFRTQRGRIIPDNILQHDGTPSGALFKLWESIRLNPCKNNIGLMIELLHRMQPVPSYIFEELPFYQQFIHHVKA
jgi:hypothetical protein